MRWQEVRFSQLDRVDLGGLKVPFQKHAVDARGAGRGGDKDGRCGD